MTKWPTQLFIDSFIQWLSESLSHTESQAAQAQFGLKPIPESPDGSAWLQVLLDWLGRVNFSLADFLDFIWREADSLRV